MNLGTVLAIAGATYGILSAIGGLLTILKPESKWTLVINAIALDIKKGLTVFGK
jgi:hypothetical protein